VAEQGRAVVCRTSVADGISTLGPDCVRDASAMRACCVSPRSPLRRMLGACRKEAARSPRQGRLTQVRIAKALGDTSHR
jgi:hypothetical protein